MEHLLRRLEKWIETNRPDFLESLSSGASDKALDELEHRIDTKLPTPFRELYRWHNGQTEGFGFFASYTLMPIDFIVDAWEGDYARLADHVVEGREFVAGDPHWIPFLHSGGNFICLDLTGVQAGKPGQIVDDEKPSQYFILAPGLESWLETYITSLELGYWRADEEGAEFYPIEATEGDGTPYGKLIQQRLPGFPITVAREPKNRA